MAQQARQALSIAPRYQKPANYIGTDVSWRVLCDLYPAAETPEIIMAVMEYCAMRRLDPFKAPVHIVPMYNSKLRRRVQVVMRGINELEITAHRTKVFAGTEEADYGPEETKTFRGTQEDERGESREVAVTLIYPISAAVKVYRLVQGEKVAFSERVFFAECYGRAGFRSEVPNERWSKAPKQMLAKCAKAASLRLAFPEEMGGEYAHEEMEDREIDTGGMTIEGRVDHGDPGLTERDRRIEQPPASAPSGAATGLAALDAAPNDTEWVRALTRLLKAAASEAEVVEIAGHPRVVSALQKAPTLIRQNITDMLGEAHKRVAPTGAGEDAPFEDPPADDWPDDPIRDLLGEIEEMDLDALDTIAISTAWKVKTRDLFPPDRDRIDEAIALRRATLKGGKAT
jgi:phage recombination protein Bet